MTLWRRYDVRKFDADTILFREILCKKRDILIFKQRFQSALGSSRPGKCKCMKIQQTTKVQSSAKVIKKISCSTQLRPKFQLLIKTKIPTNEYVSCLSLSDVVFIMLINVKMPFMSRINFVLSWVMREKNVYNRGARTVLLLFAYAVWFSWDQAYIYNILNMYIILTLSFKIQCNYKVKYELRQEFVFAGDKNFTHRLIITNEF